eukprot:352670-Chlamydomonas_euryale.AAC.5
MASNANNPLGQAAAADGFVVRGLKREGAKPLYQSISAASHRCCARAFASFFCPHLLHPLTPMGRCRAGWWRLRIRGRQGSHRKSP